MPSDTTYNPLPTTLRGTLSGYYLQSAVAGRLIGLDWLDRFGHWAIRIPLALLLLDYGLQKFPDAFVAPGAYGVPAALFILAAFAEILGPIALMIGGAIETWRPKSGVLRLAGDALTRAGGFAGIAAVGGVIAFFYWGALYPTDPHVMQFGLALYLMMRGNR
jgi:hypothetical protein